MVQQTDFIAFMYHWSTETDAIPQRSSHTVLTDCTNKLFNKPKRFSSDYSSLTFEQLAQQNITSQQLYFFWSAPIDLAERYQQYLDQPHHSQWMRKEVNDVFYNCTWPRFGPSCEYSFAHLSSSSVDSVSSLNELIQDYYDPYRHKGRTLTCYEYLQCDRGPSPFCLDWSEICDGKIDCQDGGRDEADCNRSSLIDCPSNARLCALIETDKWSCLPVEKINDGHIDCVGAMDERKVCRNFSEYYKTDWFHCGNATEFTCIPFGVICNGNTECVQGGDDERKTFHEYVQENIQSNDKLSIVHFSLTDSKTSNEQSSRIHHASSWITKRTDDSSSLFENQCHRGLSLRYWSDSSDSNITTITCVCPHSYYGQYCQFQNERVAVALQFRSIVATSSVVKFAFYI